MIRIHPIWVISPVLYREGKNGTVGSGMSVSRVTSAKIIRVESISVPNGEFLACNDFKINSPRSGQRR